MTFSPRSLTLSLLHDRYTVLRFMSEAIPPAWAMKGDFFSVTRSKDELSVVTNIENLPSWEQAQSEWHAFKVHGPFAFTEIGILASLTAPLRDDAVGIFVVSTFDTDYLLVEHSQVDKAIRSLRRAGHSILNSEFQSEGIKEKTE